MRRPLTLLPALRAGDTADKPDPSRAGQHHNADAGQADARLTPVGDVATAPPGAVATLCYAPPNASSRIVIPSLSSSSPMTSGGRNRSTFPNVPHVSSTRPAAWQALATLAVVSGSGTSVPGLTSSIASIAPRPRTSPMTG